MYVCGYMCIYIICFRHPLGTQVPGTTTLFPLRSNGAKYASPWAKKRGPREMSRDPTETQPEDQLRQPFRVKPKRPTDKRDSHQAKPKKKWDERGGATAATQGPAEQ